mmetsp:Transcript_20484/g.65401  ORF Transcript_20484/g.65401 Transcript_20484/m.65401 type:complete len:341 (+) Transcript_20484:748-1770(+)
MRRLVPPAFPSLGSLTLFGSDARFSTRWSQPSDPSPPWLSPEPPPPWLPPPVPPPPLCAPDGPLPVPELLRDGQSWNSPPSPFLSAAVIAASLSMARAAQAVSACGTVTTGNSESSPVGTSEKSKLSEMNMFPAQSRATNHHCSYVVINPSRSFAVARYEYTCLIGLNQVARLPGSPPLGPSTNLGWFSVSQFFSSHSPGSLLHQRTAKDAWSLVVYRGVFTSARRKPRDSSPFASDLPGESGSLPLARSPAALVLISTQMSAFAGHSPWLVTEISSIQEWSIAFFTLSSLHKGQSTADIAFLHKDSTSASLRAPLCLAAASRSLAMDGILRLSWRARLT